MISQGIYTDLSSDDYHADKQSLSRSSLKDFKKNPYYYWAMHLSPDKPAHRQTQEMTFGSAFHTFILEPLLFDDEYAVEPEKKMLKYDGEDEYRAYKLECEELARSSKTVLSSDEMETLKAIKAAMLRDPRVMQLIEGAEIEKSFFWEDPASGLMVKARPDILHKRMIVDLKTCADASPQGFQRAMVDGWYHVQAGMIRDAIWTLEGRDIPNAICINVEKKYPYLTSITIIEESAIEVGQAHYKNILLELKSCLINNAWPDYETATIGLPKWMS